MGFYCQTAEGSSPQNTKLCLAWQWFCGNTRSSWEIQSPVSIDEVIEKGKRRPLPSEICAQSDPPPSKNADFDRYPLIYNVSTVRDSEKSSIMTNIKLTTGFPTSYRWRAYVTPKSRKGGSKSNYFVFLTKSQRLIVSGAVNLVRR